MSQINKKRAYCELLTFQIATIIYDATCGFCDTYLENRGRSADLMMQAARQGRQSIAHAWRKDLGCEAEESSFHSIARRCLEELLLDYEDFVRHQRCAQWTSDHAEARALGNVLSDKKNQWAGMSDTERFGHFAVWLDDVDPIVRANALICLIQQLSDLLDAEHRELTPEPKAEAVLGSSKLKKATVKKLAPKPVKPTERVESKQYPNCPECDGPMMRRTLKIGKKCGGEFLSCLTYPSCRGELNLS